MPLRALGFTYAYDCKDRPEGPSSHPPRTSRRRLHPVDAYRELQARTGAPPRRPDRPAHSGLPLPLRELVLQKPYFYFAVLAGLAIWAVIYLLIASLL